MEVRAEGYDQNTLESDQLPYFIAAAHELKAPLALIRQLALSLEGIEMTADEQARLLRQIALTSEKGLRLTTDLTRSYRLEDGLFELEPINSRQLCEEVAHELTPLYTAKGRELRVASGRGQIMALANRDLLSRIVTSFADNALHYGDDRAPVFIQTSRSNSTENVRISVRDYGPALPAAIWKKIKLRLGSSPQLLQNRPASSGLGLYIASQFAEAMQGSIGATRHSDGTTFFVDLHASQQLKLL